LLLTVPRHPAGQDKHQKKGPKFDIHKMAWIGSIGKHQNICATLHQQNRRADMQTIVAGDPRFADGKYGYGLPN